VSDPFASIVGQPRAVEQLRAASKQPVHAYLFVGPAGSGKRSAARAFAAALLDDDRPLQNTHPDVVTVEREGASINVGQAREIGRLAARSPGEGNRKILVLTDFHLVEEAAPALLKTIEEASASTVFIILADTATRELVTVASRCVRIDFCALPVEVIKATLLAEGIDPQRAKAAAESAFGNMSRARLLAADDAVVARRELWRDIPMRLDGTGAMSAQLSDEVAASLDEAMAPLLEQQAEEEALLKIRAKETGQNAGSAKVVEARQKREQRRLRTDELKAGLATLAQEYGRRLLDVSDSESAKAVRDALEAVTWATKALAFNPNEILLLQGLFVRLSQLPSRRATRTS